MAVLCKCENCGSIVYDSEMDEGWVDCESCGEDNFIELNGELVNINTMTDDDGLREWCDSKSWEQLKVTEVDSEAGLVWVHGCPFGISYKDIF